MLEYIFEHSELSFSAKFKALRGFYKLPAREMAGLLNYKSSANVAFFEKYPMTNKPTFQLLISMNQLFGISIDWMLGIGEKPYTEESIRQAEIAQDERFVVAASIIAEDSDAPENIMYGIKTGLFPRVIIQGKLELRDRFILLFLLNYISYALDQYYVQNRAGILKKKLQGLAELLGFTSSSNPLSNLDGIVNTMKKHQDFVEAFLQFADTLKSPEGIPYSLYPALVLPGQSNVEKLGHSLLDERWNFERYLDENTPTIRRNYIGE